MNAPYALTVLVQKMIADTTDEHSTIMRTLGAYARDFRAAVEARAIDIAPGAGYRAPLPHGLTETVNRMVDLFNGLSFSAAYGAWQDERIEKLAKTLAADDMFRATIGNLKKASAGDLLSVARLISTTQQSIFCEGLPIAAPTMHVTWLPARDPSGGLYQPPPAETGTHRLSFRTDDKSPLRSVSEGLDTIFHENLHMTQAVLAFAYARGAMGGHALERDARLHLMTSVDASTYFNGVRSLYFAHPSERDAWEKSPQFVDTLRRALKPYGMAI